MIYAIYFIIWFIFTQLHRHPGFFDEIFFWGLVRVNAVLSLTGFWSYRIARNQLTRMNERFVCKKKNIKFIYGRILSVSFRSRKDWSNEAQHDDWDWSKYAKPTQKPFTASQSQNMTRDVMQNLPQEEIDRRNNSSRCRLLKLPTLGARNYSKARWWQSSFASCIIHEKFLKSRRLRCVSSLDPWPREDWRLGWERANLKGL